MGSITSDASLLNADPVTVHHATSITSNTSITSITSNTSNTFVPLITPATPFSGDNAQQETIVQALVLNEKDDIMIQDEAQDTEIRVEKQDRVFHLLEVNKVNLQDDEAIVVRKLGKPQAITIDPDISVMKTYEYKDMNIGFVNGIVDYVQVFATAGTIQIDNEVLPITIEDVTNALGGPDFEAEDGLVFQRNEYLIKIFTDETTGNVVSVDYYHLSST